MGCVNGPITIYALIQIMNDIWEIWYCNGMSRWLRIGVLLLVATLSQTAWCASLSVKIEGIDNELRDHVFGYLDIKREAERDEFSLGRLQRVHDKAEEQIKTALQVYGYYHVHVKSELREEQQSWIATYTVDLGDPVKILTLDISVSGEGQDDPVMTEALKKLPLAKGDVLKHPEYEKARNILWRTAIERGFLDAEYLKRQVNVDLRSYTAEVNLHLQTGKRYYFGPVQFDQNVMDEAFLRRYVKFNPGDPYNPAKLLQLQTTLSDSGLFQSVEVSPVKKSAIDNHVPIQVTLTERKSRQWRFGLGYATDTGARGSVSHTRIVGEEGYKFSSKLLISEKKNSLYAGYTIPLADPVTDQLGFGVRYEDEITDSRESTISGVTTSHTTNWGEWQRIISLNYEREIYIIATEPEETRRVLFPAISLTKVEADDRLYTRKGYRIFAELRGANDNILSDTNYAQLRLGLKWIRAFGEDNRVLLRGDFGTTNVAYLDRLPASQRFFAGGDNSVRGYAYEELGPKNDKGEVVGGKHLVVGSVELERRIAGNWSAAVFYDVGNAVNSIGDELAAGAGIGLRWNSPVGPIRLDFAWALDKDVDRFRLHVIIGPDL